MLKSLTCLVVWLSYNLLHHGVLVSSYDMLISNSDIRFVDLLLLTFSLIYSTKQQKDNSEVKEFELSSQVSPWIYWSGWPLYAIGFTISSLHKPIRMSMTCERISWILLFIREVIKS